MLNPRGLLRIELFPLTFYFVRQHLAQLADGLDLAGRMGHGNTGSSIPSPHGVDGTAPWEYITLHIGFFDRYIHPILKLLHLILNGNHKTLFFLRDNLLLNAFDPGWLRWLLIF